jgi:hypothetical protein
VSEAYAFLSFALRGVISSMTGIQYGNLGMDEAVGRAAEEIKPSHELADMHPLGAVILGMCSGGWRALNVPQQQQQPKKRRSKKNVQEGQQNG